MMSGSKWVLLMMAGLMMAGCSSRKEEQAQEVAAEDPFYAVYDAANEAMAAGNTNAAIDVFREACADEEFGAERGRFFRSALEMMLGAGRVDEAREEMVTALREKAPYAEGAFGTIYRYYVGKGDADSTLAWIRQLVDSNLSGQMELYAAAWHMVALYDVEGAESAVALVPACISSFPEEQARGVIRGLVDRIVSAGDQAAAGILDKIDEHAADRPLVRSLVSVARAEMLMSQKKWQEAGDYLRAVAADLEDGDLAGAMKRFDSQAAAGGASALVEGLCEFVLENVQDKPRAREVAASDWLTAAISAADHSTTVERLGRLLDVGLPWNSVFRLYQKSFYGIVNSGNNETIARLVALGDKMAESAGPDEFQGLRMLMLDASFLLEDYDRALALVEEGIPGRDEEWQAMALNKISAHKALKENRPEEAIRRFRVFMAGVEEWDEAETDPSTGVMHTREMTLGRNALRIGKIYADMGSEVGASKAYEEAADYYTRALMAVEPDSKEYGIIKAEMSDLPSEK